MALGLLAAAFAVAATPTGLIAVAPFLAAARPLWRLCASASASGAGCRCSRPSSRPGCSCSWRSSPTRLGRGLGGDPAAHPARPELDLVPGVRALPVAVRDGADGSLARRFPVLLLICAIVVCLVVLLRRGKIAGAALGPSQRLIGSSVLAFAVLALTPTKWTHHFGAFAPLGAAMAALTALATSSTVLRSPRNRLAFTSGLLVVAALAATGPNASWYVSSFGVPWFDKPPSLRGYQLSTFLLGAALVVAVIAFVQNIRMERPGAPPQPQERRGRALFLGLAPLVIVCGLVVMVECGSMAKAMHKQRDSYSIGAANFQQIFGDSCNLSDKVLVERDATASVLRPVYPGEDRSEAGFHRKPVDRDDPISKPPSGFDPNVVPMWSSYRDETSPTGTLRTDWYELPQDARTGQVVVGRAGQTTDGRAELATSITAEFGHRARGVSRSSSGYPCLPPPPM